eukprot:580862-Amphidinium_carterae.2
MDRGRVASDVRRNMVWRRPCKDYLSVAVSQPPCFRMISPPMQKVPRRLAPTSADQDGSAKVFVFENCICAIMQSLGNAEI